jgi:U4/U6.U5 tri-snRNP component SNU23
MRVERADADRVKKHIEDLKNNINAKANKVYLSSMEAHELKVSAALAAEEEKKKKKQEEKLRKAAEIEKTFEDADPEIAELMGFQGFGGSKKK